MECLSFVGGSMFLQWPLAEAHFSPVSQQVFTSSLADTVMKHKQNPVPDLSHSELPQFSRKSNKKNDSCNLAGGRRQRKHLTIIEIHQRDVVKIWLQDLPSGSCFWWLNAENSKYNLCSPFQTARLYSHFHWQGKARNPRLYLNNLQRGRVSVLAVFLANQSWSAVKD